MSMFPGANATVYRNDAGEVMGWSDESYYEPDYDPYDDDFFYDDDDDDDDDEQEDVSTAMADWATRRAESGWGE